FLDRLCYCAAAKAMTDICGAQRSSVEERRHHETMGRYHCANSREVFAIMDHVSNVFCSNIELSRLSQWVYILVSVE
ncbi:hypothetical protein BDZ89DRAFT_1069358, partial [Hymenopellis radicata]